MSLQQMHWADAVRQLEASGESYVLATIIGTAGSTPRDAGSKMVITAEHTFASVGGGGFEFIIVQRARELIAEQKTSQEIKQFSLGAEAKQCCGGSITVLLEPFIYQLPRLAIFGAGHVAQSLVTILSQLDFIVDWIDSREALLRQNNFPRRVNVHCVAEPENFVPKLKDNTHCLILTHDHSLDYRLCYGLLSQWRWSFVGLIGSDIKAKRFRKRLLNDGIDQQTLDLLQCPVGLEGLKGKLPMEVAVSICAELLRRQPETDTPRLSPKWREIKTILNHANAEV